MPLKRSIVIMLFALACNVDDVDDTPELQSECPGGLLCPCFVDEQPAACAEGFTCNQARHCTRGCASDADCTEALPDAACVAGTCALPCDDVASSCDELGLSDAWCRAVPPMADELVCAYGEA